MHWGWVWRTPIAIMLSGSADNHAIDKYCWNQLGWHYWRRSKTTIDGNQFKMSTIVYLKTQFLWQSK